MCNGNSIEGDRALEWLGIAMHDSIVRAPGGSRFHRHGKSIKHFGVRLAAQILGRSEDEIRNKADINKPDRFNQREIELLMIDGMDPIWAEELVRLHGGVVIYPDKRECHDRISDEIMACCKHFGTLCEDISMARSADSPGGEKITRRELQQIRDAVQENVAELFALMDAVECEAK